MELQNRRVLVGVDAQGRSAVVADAQDMALAYPPTGVRDPGDLVAGAGTGPGKRRRGP